MNQYISDIAFTPAVKVQQQLRGSRHAYARMESGPGWRNSITPDLAEFVAARDSFYLATSSAEGQPYIQHRGGPAGFLKVIDARTLAFADYSGNRQYVTVGNLSENDRAFIFLMDYASRKRVKLWGRARAVENDASLLERVRDPEYKVKVERVIVFDIEAWDINCDKHITQRYTAEEWATSGHQ